MNDMIMARFAEIDSGATHLASRMGERRDLADENLGQLRALHGDGHTDAVGAAMMADEERNYALHMADVERGQRHEQAMRASNDCYMDTQQRCLSLYGGG